MYLFMFGPFLGVRIVITNMTPFIRVWGWSHLVMSADDLHLMLCLGGGDVSVSCSELFISFRINKWFNYF